MVAQGPALPHVGAVRKLEDADLHRRSQMSWHDRAMDHRPADEPGNFETWVETRLAPELLPGDIVIHDGEAGKQMIQ
jgi:hypothetical protein